ncbi:MAG: flgA [Rickettsiaceae bacterium]|jgi:flagella basal body P-ring formation protein FlgA|nr:flgA [Rickettsiaceae bacterium]
MKIKKFFAVLVYFVLASASYADTVSFTTEPSVFDNLSVISTEKISDLISQSLLEKTEAYKIEVTIRNPADGIKLKSKHDAFDTEIVKADFNKNSRRFKYTLSFSADGYSEQIDIDGSYLEIVKVPVAKTKLDSKSIIVSDNFEYAEKPKSRVQQNTIMDIAELNGKKIKHAVKEGNSIRTIDLEKQIIVSRGNNVTIIYETPAMKLQAAGVAMDSGGKSDLIRIRNSTSNKIVQAEIKNETTVIVQAQTNE